MEQIPSNIFLAWEKEVLKGQKERRRETVTCGGEIHFTEVRGEQEEKGGKERNV